MNDQKLQRILIVDDSAVNTKILMKLLMDDYKVITATNGVQALTLAQNDPQPDLILLDIMMPEMDGYEVCKRLKADDRTKMIPIIFVSALDSNDDEYKGFEFGAVDYFTKPLVLKLAKARVSNHLKLKNYQDQLEYLSLHDDLTGLYNTRYLYNTVQRYFSLESENSRFVSAIFMDVDNFKQVVDTYGHLNGSQAIKEIAGSIMDVIEEPCFGVAYGGDEFVVILPEYNKEEAYTKALAIRQQINNTSYLSDAGYNISLSCSYGVATTTTRSGNITSLLAEADSRLFEIKRIEKGGIGVAGNTNG